MFDIIFMRFCLTKWKYFCKFATNLIGISRFQKTYATNNGKRIVQC